MLKIKLFFLSYDHTQITILKEKVMISSYKKARRTIVQPFHLPLLQLIYSDSTFQTVLSNSTNVQPLLCLMLLLLP